MAALLLFGALAMKYATSSVLSPGCNYAADDFHFYPIGSCVGQKTGSTYSSFKYVCNGGGNQVRKLEYQGSNNCNGDPIDDDPEPVTGILRGYECDAGACTYSYQCSITGCINNGDCSECIDNSDNYDEHCLPWITDHCAGNTDGLLIKDVCSEGVNTQNYYFGGDCSDGNIIFQIPIADGTCDSLWDNAYFTVSCNNIAHVGPPYGKGNGGAAVASDIIMDNNNNNKYVYISLLDLILISTNLVTIMICLGVCYKYTASKKKMVYTASYDSESESKSLNNL